MNRPHIICHMMTSIDGKVTGDFLGLPNCEAATEVYYEINRKYKAQRSGGFINGHFLCTDCVDELSLVQAPAIADADSKPLFTEGTAYSFDLVSAEQQNGILVTNYKKK